MKSAQMGMTIIIHRDRVKIISDDANAKQFDAWHEGMPYGPLR